MALSWLPLKVPKKLPPLVLKSLVVFRVLPNSVTLTVAPNVGGLGVSGRTSTPVVSSVRCSKDSKQGLRAVVRRFRGPEWTKRRVSPSNTASLPIFR